MAEQVTNYQCPSCMGPLHFEGASGRLECEYCGSSFSVAEIEALYGEKDRQAAQTPGETGDHPENASGADTDWGEDAGNMRAYTCPSCGAELICDATTAATACPYCGNPAVVPGQFGGTLRPEYVIPFKLSKEEAVAALRRHYRGKPFLPKTFTDENHILEIKGVYVPFWMFDGTAQGSARYEATRSRLYRRGDEEITETRHYDVYRAGSVTFERLPVDASSKMPDDYMDSIEPYDYSELKPFSTGYLPGFLADKYDVTVEQCRERAELRCQNSLEEALRGTVEGYETCLRRDGTARVRHGKVSYALLPVWMLSTKWKGKNYLFAMNGQTGRLVGDLPVSWGKFWGLFAAIFVPLSILGIVISCMMV